MYFLGGGLIYQCLRPLTEIFEPQNIPDLKDDDNQVENDNEQNDEMLRERDVYDVNDDK